MLKNNLPQGWVECEFEFCIEKINTQKKVKQKEYLEEGLFPIIDQGQKLIGGYSNKSDFVINIETPVIVFGDHTRCFKYIDFDFVSGADGTKIIKPLGFFDEKLFYYFCKTLNFPNKGYSRHFQYLLKSVIYIPPLNEQKKIVEKIENEFGKIDEGIEKLKLVQEQIKQYKQSVLKSAFEGKLYKTTEWEEKKLKDVTTKISDGSHNPPPKQEFGVPMLSGRNIKNGKINFDEYRYITESEFQLEIKRTPIEAGDILLTIVGTIGETAVVPENLPKFAIQRSVALLKPQISSFYLKYYLDSPMAFSYYKKNEKGTAQKGIYLETLKNMIIKLPIDKDAQQKIVAEIEKRFEVADNVAKVVEENLEKAEQLKQSILKKAFEGRLVPQDPTDEPASVLLERIKKERKKND